MDKLINNLKGIVSDLEAAKYESEAGPLKNNMAFIELKRIAELQLRQLHTGQSIERYLDSAIKLWRRKRALGGGTAVMAEHYIDAIQSVRISIFGEQLPAGEDGVVEEIGPANRLENDFKHFITSNGLSGADDDTKALLRRAYEAAYTPDVLFLEDSVIAANDHLYREMSEKERKGYDFNILNTD